MTTAESRTTVPHLISFLFGVILLLIGIVNTFWGNDPGLGAGLIILSFIYYPPVTDFIRKRFGFAVPGLVKILLAIALLWVVLGVGELFAKIELMRESF